MRQTTTNRAVNRAAAAAALLIAAGSLAAQGAHAEDRAFKLSGSYTADLAGTVSTRAGSSPARTQRATGSDVARFTFLKPSPGVV